MSESWRDWTPGETAAWIRRPTASDDKYSRGVVGVVTGSAEYPGAAVLGVEAAARAGAGMVRYLGDREAARFVLQRRPEVVTADGRVQSWLVGSGMDSATRSGELAAQLGERLGQGVPVVLDAGALDLVDRAAGPALLTPHAGELVRVLAAHGIEVSRADVEADPARWAREAADWSRAVVLLKGAVTHIVAPGGNQGIRVQGRTAWLATAGSGDVLGGILGTLLAAHSDRILDDPRLLAEVAAAGADLHARAGERASGGGPIVALDIAEAAPAVMAELLGQDSTAS